jgi:hypothetical protein
VLSHGRENVHCELFVQKPCRIKRRGALPDLEMELGREPRGMGVSRDVTVQVALKERPYPTR